MRAQAIASHEPPLATSTLDITFQADALPVLVREFERHGDAFRLHSPALGRDLWVLSHPDHVRHVLVDHHADFVKGTGIERVAILLGNGLMTSEGEHWRRQRKMVQPSFHRNVIASWMPHIHATTRKVAQRWENAARQGASINLTQDMSEATLEVVLLALFGCDLPRLGTAFSMLTDHTARDLAFAYKFRRLSKLIMEDVDRRRRDGVRHGDIVSLLLDARDRQTGEPMSDRELLDEIMTLIVAGHETTASSLNWFWYLLTQSGDVERRLHAEADGSDEDPGYEALVRHPYARRVVEETLRLYPPGWLLTRRSTSASPIGDFELAAGTDVLVSPYLVHRHPRYWRDAGRFDPDRFLPDAVASRSRFAYLPFGLGPRACIGEHLALIEMQAHAIMLARRFRLTLVPGQRVEIEAHVNLRPRRALHMNVELR
jgi:cytochrome P450